MIFARTCSRSAHGKKLKAADIIARKRVIDTVIYANRPYFLNDFLRVHDAFVRNVFCMYGGGTGEDAPLRTAAAIQFRETNDARFTGEDNRKAIHESYYSLLNVVATELGLENIGVPQAAEKPRADRGPATDEPFNKGDPVRGESTGYRCPSA